VKNAWKIGDDEFVSEGDVRPLDNHGSVESRWILRPLHQDAGFERRLTGGLHLPFAVVTVRTNGIVSHGGAREEKLLFDVSARRDIAEVAREWPTVSATRNRSRNRTHVRPPMP